MPLLASAATTHREVDPAFFEAHIDRYVELAQLYQCTLLPHSVLDQEPDLRAWLLHMEDAARAGQLSTDQRARLLQVPDISYVFHNLDWVKQAREVSGYVAARHVDLSRDSYMRDRHEYLVWVREQQTSWSTLGEVKQRLLRQIPGWAEQTMCDRVATGDLAGLLYLSFAAHTSEERELARLVLKLDVETVRRMILSGELAGDRIEDVLTSSFQASTRQRGLALLAIEGFAPNGPEREKVLEFVALRLDDFVAGDLAISEVSTLPATLVQAVLLTHQRFAACGVRPDLPGTSRDTVRPVLAPRPAPLSEVPAERGEHVSRLGLSRRTYNVLVREDLTHVGDVLAIEDPDELLRLRGFGHTCLVNLREALIRAGHSPTF